MNKFNEIISAMSDKLDAFGVPHEIEDRFEGAIIRFPWTHGDVACHRYTFGSEHGYVETFRFPWQKDEITMIRPEEALERILILYVEQMRNCLTTLSALSNVVQPLLNGDEG